MLYTCPAGEPSHDPSSLASTSRLQNRSGLLQPKVSSFWEHNGSLLCSAEHTHNSSHKLAHTDFLGVGLVDDDLVDD